MMLLKKKYFNGKLAEVVDLDDDEIWVRIDGDDEDYKPKKEIWEQKKKYTLDTEKHQRRGFGQFRTISYSFGMGSYDS